MHNVDCEARVDNEYNRIVIAKGGLLLGVRIELSYFGQKLNLS